MTIGSASFDISGGDAVFGSLATAVAAAVSAAVVNAVSNLAVSVRSFIVDPLSCGRCITEGSIQTTWSPDGDSTSYKFGPASLPGEQAQRSELWTVHCRKVNVVFVLKQLPCGESLKLKHFIESWKNSAMLRIRCGLRQR
jgi:hypothetical protein